MGANATQGAGVAVLLAGSTLLAAGIASGSVVLDVLGLAVVLTSFGLFRKCKPWEEAE